MPDCKIVCLGFPKTGTKSMANIFQMFNLKVNSNPISNDAIFPEYIILDNNINYYCDDMISVNQNLEYFDAFHDIPYSLDYINIYNLYPNSKFILTIRDPDLWFNSLYNYVKIPGAANKKIIKYLFGISIITMDDKKSVIETYIKHNEQIINFFKDKNNLSNLLIIDITNTNSSECWNIITSFLNIENVFTQRPFPICNKQTYDKF